MRAFFGFVEFEEGASGDDDLAVFEIVHQGAFEGEHTGFSIHQGEQLHSKGRLKRGVFIELVEHSLRLGAAFELNHDAHAVTVRLVAHIRDGVNASFTVKGGDAFDQAGFVELIRDLVDDYRETSVANFFNGGGAAHREVTATGAVCLADALAADDDAASGEVWSGNELHQVFHADLIQLVEAVDKQVESRHQLPQIVRRDIGCHTNRDTVGAVHQQVGNTRGQNFRLLERAIKVIQKVNRVFIQVSQNFIRNFG